MLQFFCYLVDHGVFDEIEYKFQVKGHTRNTVDRGFAYAKKKYVVNDTWCLDDYVKTVEKSSESNIGVDATEIPFYDWAGMLSGKYVPFPGIRKYHMFVFNKSIPGHMLVKTIPSAEWIRVKLSKEGANNGIFEWPTVVGSRGLKEEKQHDLYTKVRPYVPGPYQDILCPKPDSYLMEVVKEVKADRARKYNAKQKEKRNNTNSQ